MTTTKNVAQVAAQAELCLDERRMLALHCTWDISGIAEAVTLMAETAEADGDVASGALLRCYGMHIATLNGLLMAYLDEDDITAKDMHKKIFGCTKPFAGAPA